MAEATPAAMAVIRAGRIVAANPAARRLLGNGADVDPVGRPVSGFLDRESRRAAIGAFRAPEKATALTLRTTDGAVAPVWVHLAATTWQGEPAVLATVSAIDANPGARDDAASRLAELEKLVANVPGLIYQRRRSPSGEVSISYISGSVSETHGLTPEQVKSNPQFLIDAVHPDDRARIVERLNKALAEVSPVDQRFRLVEPDGTVKWVHATTRPRREPDGSIVWDGLLRDITELKQQEEAIELRERALMASPDGIYICDHVSMDEPVITYVNPAFERITGYASNEAIMRNPRLLSGHDRDQPGLAKLHEALDKGEPASVLLRSYRKNGEPFINGMRLAPIRDHEGRLTHYVGIIRDVTDQMEMRERLRVAIETMPDGLAIFDDQNRLVLCNSAYRNGMHGSVADLVEPGVTPQTLIRAAFERGGLGKMTEDEVEKWIETVRRNFKEPRDEEWHRADGKWIRTRSCRLPHGGTLFIFTDISRRKDAEQLEAQLRHKQRIEALGTLAGGTAHEFNNMLVPIKTLAELCLMEMDDASPLRGHLDKIIASADRASQLVRRVLDYSRAEDVAERRATKLDDVVRDTVQLLRRTIPSTVRITVEVVTDDAVAMADPGQIEQVLMNLAANAAHAIGGKIGELTIRLDVAAFDKKAELGDADLAPGRYFRIAVSDTGHGIDPETRQRVFDPFFTTKPVGEGTGLGLSVSQGIVKAHGGAITVESEPGVGTTFRVYLPALDGLSREVEPDSRERVA